MNGHNVICFQGLMHYAKGHYVYPNSTTTRPGQTIGFQFPPSYLGLTGLTREGIPITQALHCQRSPFYLSAHIENIGASATVLTSCNEKNYSKNYS